MDVSSLVKLALCTALVAASCGSGRAWQRLQPQALPARVSAILFPGGKRLDRSTSAVYGAWRIELSGAPTARGYYGMGGLRRVDVTGLTCKNKVVGSVGCMLSMENRPPTVLFRYEGSPCMLHLGHHPPLAIDCPVDLVLDR